MRRRVLLTSALLGSIVTLLGFTGLIAPFTDRATTGENSLETGARAREVDLQLALRNETTGGCGAFADDLTTGLISATDVQPATTTFGGAQVCLKNAGSSAASATVSALNLTDIDTACTGDEGVLDTSCGGNAAGELAAHVGISFSPFDCTSGAPAPGAFGTNLSGLAAFPLGLDLGPGEVVCLSPGWTYQASADDATRAQSDRVTWQYAFDGAQVTTP